MILFSSFNHLYLFLIFTYLGVASGVVFFSTYFAFNKLKNKISIKRFVKKNKELCFKDKTKPAVKPKSKKQHKKASKKTLKKINNLTKGFLYIKKAFNKIIFAIKKTSVLFIEVAKVTVLLIVVTVSYYVNLYYNFGELRIVYILVWILGFLVSFIAVKKVAKIFLSFYNKHTNKKS